MSVSRDNVKVFFFPFFNMLIANMVTLVKILVTNYIFHSPW